MAARLANVVHSPSAGHRIGPGQEGAQEVDLGHALHAGGIVHFSLPEPPYGDEAATLAALVAGATHAGAHAEGAACDLLVDEAHALGAARLVRLIRVARSAGIGVILATQATHDYAEHTEAIWGSCAAKIVHRQEGRSAEYAGQAAGTYKTHKTTERWEAGGWLSPPTTGGELSVREVDEFRVSPNVIRELPRGRAVVIARVPVSNLDLVEVAAP